MEKIVLPCLDATLTLDPDAKMLVIDRKKVISKSVPMKKEIPFDQLTGIEFKDMSFAMVGVVKGNVTMRLLYPGSPEGNMMTEAMLRENMVQYKGREKPTAQKIVDYMEPIIAENKARMGL